MDSIMLRNPIVIDGVKVSNLTYDMDAITVDEFMAAEGLSTAKRVSFTAGVNPPVAAFDKGLHLYLGFAGILAVNPAYDVSDLERVKGTDIMQIINIGRDFTVRSSGAQSAEAGNSADAADSTQSDTTQV